MIKLNTKDAGAQAWLEKPERPGLPEQLVTAINTLSEVGITGTSSLYTSYVEEIGNLP